MFDLESSITRWRQQMLAAGITPATLDELECHLREESARQSDAGLDELAAFQVAVHKIGQPAPLNTEFKKSAGWLGWLSPDRTALINCLLGVVWFIYSVVSFSRLTGGLSANLGRPNFSPTPMFFLALVLELIYFLGIIASLGIFTGVRQARRYLLFLAGLAAFCGVIALALKPSQPVCAFYTAVGFITLWLL